MEDIKVKAIDEKRLSNLKHDLIELRNDTYNIVNIDYDNLTITISGLLFDLQKWNCLYISPFGNNGELTLEY